MKHYSRLLLTVVFLLASLMVFTATLAVGGDYDNDGVPDAQDQCPKVAGPKSNNGCPVPQSNTNTQPEEQPLHPPGDSDGDGTLDEQDKCVLDGGPSWNNGCPTDLTAPPQPGTQVVLPTMPTDGPCFVATSGQDSVNVRNMPGVTNGIIAVLQATELYPAFATFNGDGETWYLLRNGWSAGSVLRFGELCDRLPSFEFGDVQIGLGDGPGNGLVLSFLPVPGGKPFVTLHPFATGAMHFTKVDDAFPDAGFSFLLIPFPGGANSENPPANPVDPGADVFDDGYLRSQMGDGSVFILMPPTNQGDANPLNGILIGLSQPEVDPTGILIGLSKPTIDPTGILIGLNQPGADQDGTQGILIGLLLPAVQTGEENPAGILIGLLQPSLEGAAFGFGGEPFDQGGAEVHPGGVNNPGEQVSVQKVRQMGLDFYVPSTGAATEHMFTAGWGLDLEGFGTPGQLGTVSSN